MEGCNLRGLAVKEIANLSKGLKIMSTALAERDLKFLQESGLSAQQAKNIVTAYTEKVQKAKEEAIQQAREIAMQEAKEGAVQEVAKIEEKMVTREYLDLQVDNIKKTLIIQAGGVIVSGLLLLGWYINHLDNKTRAYIEARFKAQDTRFEAQDTRFNDFKDNVNQRFDRIESDLKEIKNFIFSIKQLK